MFTSSRYAHPKRNFPMRTHSLSQYLAWQSRLQGVIVRKPQNRFFGKSDLYENIILHIFQYVKHNQRQKDEISATFYFVF